MKMIKMLVFIDILIKCSLSLIHRFSYLTHKFNEQGILIYFFIYLFIYISCLFIFEDQEVTNQYSLLAHICIEYYSENSILNVPWIVGSVLFSFHILPTPLLACEYLLEDTSIIHELEIIIVQA